MYQSQLDWRRTSFCNNGSCVEVAYLDDDDQVAVRDSKDHDGPMLIFTATEWDGFLSGVRDGQFDRHKLARPLT